MNINVILEYFSKYGLIFLFIVDSTVRLFWSDDFFYFLISIVAAVFGSIVLYIIGYYIGTPILDCLNKKIPKTEKYTEKILMYSNKYGNKAIFICRLLPVIRTLISLVSGVVRAEFGGFVLYSTMGISIWNIVLLSFGYFGVKVIIH